MSGIKAKGKRQNAEEKERPISFSCEMVRAILEGRKTQTRRVIKPQPSNDWEVENPPVFGRITSPHPKRGRFGVFIRRGKSTAFPQVDLIPCPFGEPEDKLWVRETFALSSGPNRDEPDIPDHYAVVYREDWERDQPGVSLDGNWKPSIHMPRWASRITLEITGVRVERLQDITETDAIAEGVSEYQLPKNSEDKSPARTWFRGIWSGIYGSESWGANPWVWVIEFGRVSA